MPKRTEQSPPSNESEPEIITSLSSPIEDLDKEEEEEEEPIGRPWTPAEAARAAARVNKGKTKYVSY